MESNEEFYAAPPPPPNPINQAVPALLATAVIGLGGLFIQVAKLDQSVNTVAVDIQELKVDSKERLSDIETRVRMLEMTIGKNK
jgi:hypothetical protein